MSINPILAMQQFKATKAIKAAHLPREAQLIIEAGYHCGWQSEEISERLKQAGHVLTDEVIDSHYDHYHNSIAG